MNNKLRFLSAHEMLVLLGPLHTANGKYSEKCSKLVAPNAGDVFKKLISPVTSPCIHVSQTFGTLVRDVPNKQDNDPQAFTLVYTVMTLDLLSGANFWK